MVAPAENHSATLLIVDDDAAARDRFREIFEAAQLETAKGIALRAELAAARIRSPRQLGRLLARAGVERVATIRGGVLWRV